MFQGSPFKQDRIEKHLARQRGAGVRSLATSFGFSLGFQPATAEQQDVEEPPARRRKSAHSRDDRVVANSTDRPGQAPGPQEHRVTRLTATKRKQLRWFEVRSDNEKPEATAKGSLREQEDSFLVAKKSFGRRGRPKKTQSATRDENRQKETLQVQVNPPPTVTKRRRSRKATVASDGEQVVGTVDSGSNKIQPTTLIKNRGRPPNAPAIEEIEPSTTRGPRDDESTTTSNNVIMVRDREDVATAAVRVEMPVSVEQPKPSRGKRGRPRKAPVETDASADIVASVHETGEQPRTDDACTIHHESEQVAVAPGRRPRRQAAATAMSKVSKGFIEEEAPIDKKRRDPEPETTSKRGRRKIMAPALPLDASSSRIQADCATHTNIKDNESGSSVQAVSAPTASLLGLPPQSSIAIKARTRSNRRTKSRPKVLRDPVSTETKDVLDAISKRRPGVSTHLPLSETQINIVMQTPSPEKPTDDPKVAPQSAQTGPVVVDNVQKIAAMTRDTQDAQAAVNPSKSPKPRATKSSKQMLEEESTSQKPGRYPEAISADFAQATKHAAPESGVVANQRSKGGRLKAKSTPTARQQQAISEVTYLPRERLSAPGHDEAGTTAVVPSDRTSKALLPRETIATAKSCQCSNQLATADDNRDVEWLFERAATRTTQRPAAMKKKLPSKRRIDKKVETSTAEMDLDDLLSNIASFVPKGVKAVR